MRVFWQTKRSDSFDPGIFKLFLNNRRIEFVRPQKRYLQQIKSKLASLSDDSRSDLVIPLSVQCECVNSVFGHEVRVSGFWLRFTRIYQDSKFRLDRGHASLSGVAQGSRQRPLEATSVSLPNRFHALP